MEDLITKCFNVSNIEWYDDNKKRPSNIKRIKLYGYTNDEDYMWESQLIDYITNKYNCAIAIPLTFEEIK